MPLLVPGRDVDRQPGSSISGMIAGPPSAHVLRHLSVDRDTPQFPGAAGPGRHGRASCPRKRYAVSRLLQRDDLEMVLRGLGVTAATLSGWRDAFLAAGQASLATRATDGEALESERLKAHLGEMLLERDFAES